jgi:hypothetical protein
MPLKKKEKNSIDRMTDREILSAVKKQVEDSGAKITNTQGIFFIELVDYAIQKGERTGEGLRIYLTEDNMVDIFNVSKSFVIKTMALFTRAGIIERTLTPDIAKTIYGDGRIKTKPTTIYSKFFEQ